MKLKSLLRYPFDIRRAERLLSSRGFNPGAWRENPIGLDLSTANLLVDAGRHLACFAFHAQAAGSPLIVRSSRSLLAEIAHKRYGHLMLGDPAVHWIGSEKPFPPATLVLRDDAPPSGVETSPQDWQLMIGRDPVPGSLVMPFPMHPLTLPHAGDASLAAARRLRRDIRILFAGNQQLKYDNAQIGRGFGLLSRPQVLRLVRRHHAARVVGRFTDAKSRDSIVLSDSRHDPIASADWLPTVARAEFFLCPPGASQPICHHLIEAMSVGTIPILEYGQRLAPALEDGVTAIGFEGEAGLLDAIARVDRMKPADVERLRENVIGHYESNLRGDRFVRALRDRRGAEPRIISMTIHHENVYRLPAADGRRAA